MADIQVKRVYDPPDPEDGCRVLVDRIWPRGLKKEQVRADLWLKEVAPSTALRKWFDHRAEKWERFKERYFAELKEEREAVNRLLDSASEGRLTLLYSARDREHNQAVALREYLLERIQAPE